MSEADLAFTVHAPPGGWAPPWPQAAELADTLPVGSWVLVGGLMVQLHALHAELEVDRPTRDVDMVLAVRAPDQSGARRVQAELQSLGYELQAPGYRKAPSHRFTRGQEQIDIMVADHIEPTRVPRVGGRPLMEAPGGAQALQRSVRCAVQVPGRAPVVLSLPDTLGALVLKAAAWAADSRDTDRHLDDTVVLAATVKDPLAQASRMKGSDRGRLLRVWRHLRDRDHRCWGVVEQPVGDHAYEVLRVLTTNPQNLPAPPKRRG